MKTLLTLFTGMLFATLFAFTVEDNNLIGIWEYSVKDAPAKYETGVIRFSEKDGALTGDMITNNETFAITNLKVKNDTVTYDLQIESTPINVMFINLKDSISGKIFTPDTEYEFQGRKKKE